MAYVIKPCEACDAEYIWEKGFEAVPAEENAKQELLVFKVVDVQGTIIGGCVLDIDKMMNGGVTEIDLIKCNERVGGNSVTIGYDCAVAANVSKFKKLKFITSSFAYKLSIFYCLFRGRKHYFNVTVDGKRLERKGTYLLSLCAKGKYYGGGIKCAPRADNSDGYLDFMLIPTIGVFKFIRLLPSFAKGRHLDNPKADFIRWQKCREVEYECEEETDIGIDGEIFKVKKAKISVLPKAQKIILP